jgi:hypothetical protein
MYNPSKAESIDLLEPEHMKAIKNLQSYQDETRAWRDKKSQAKAHQSWGSGVAAMPAHRSLRKTGTYVNWTFRGNRKNKTRIFPLGR